MCVCLGRFGSQRMPRVKDDGLLCCFGTEVSGRGGWISWLVTYDGSAGDGAITEGAVVLAAVS